MTIGSNSASAELKGRIDGVGTCLRFLLENVNNDIVESRTQNASNDNQPFDNNIDKICHRIDELENKLLQTYSSRCSVVVRHVRK